MEEILLLGKGKSNNALNQFMIKYGIKHDFLEVNEVSFFDYRLVIKGPGIYYQNEVVKKFIDKNITIITDIEFIYWFLNRDYIAITGTNGKTTTTLLINDIINTTYSSVACGNCGYPISQAALDYKLYKYFVLELSSFELKGCNKFTPKIAVVTNIKLAHLDYHLDSEDYYKSKYKITINQTKSDYLVYNMDDELSCVIFKNSEATKLSFSLKNSNADCYVKGKYIYYKNKKICHIKKVSPKSNFMLYNAMAAICVAKILQIDDSKIKEAIKNFDGLKYRFQEIRKNIFNDAKSTNVFSTIAALKELNSKEVFLICGGFDRKEDITILENNLSNVKTVYAYGATKEKVYNFCKKRKIDVIVFDTLKEATVRALNDLKNEVILYSPMFASYDQYLSYEQRGQEFNKIISNYYAK